MGRYQRKKVEKGNETKPCRCGSGFYCHRHLSYGGVDADKDLTPKVMKVRGKSKKHKGRGSQSGAGGHN